MSTRYFHFSIGPVQGFVAQARRTRDFWAGSFLLSWLASVAIREVLHQDKNATIEFPRIDSQKLVNQVCSTGNEDSGPIQGSVPNRFKIAYSIEDNFQPESVVKAVNAVWAALAEDVWNMDLKDLTDLDTNTRKIARDIWDRQIAATWETSWAISTDLTDVALIDQRKNWRTWLPPEEAGINCSVMAGWQEISGSPRAGKRCNTFWNTIRETPALSGIKSDLREIERLCAIAYVKRRFVRGSCFADLKAPTGTGWTATGWKVPLYMPSVVWMAAVHWLEHALAHKEQFRVLHRAAGSLVEHGEYTSHHMIQCIDAAAGTNTELHKFAALDGESFFAEQLENLHGVKAAPALSALRDLIKVTGKGPPTPFYAILIMDGDSLGRELSDPGRQAYISRALDTFTGQVERIVKRKDGFLIYAGGDDVLAILPLEDATNCAVELRKCYQQAFRDAFPKELDTSHYAISAAIQYVHIKVPLTRVLRDGHDLLDDYAKDYCGRDSIAIRVRKPGGEQTLWGAPWETALDHNTNTLYIDQLATHFAQTENTREGFSSRFFFKLENTFKDIGIDSADPDDIDLAKRLMFVEYMNAYGRRFDGNASASTNENNVMPDTLLKQCIQHHRVEPDPGKFVVQRRSAASVTLSAASVVRFLATKGLT